MDTQAAFLDALPALEAISAEQPAGPDLRRDQTPQSLYYRLRDARSEARAAERQADAADDTEQAVEATLVERWRLVRDLASRALGETRDAEIGAWYVEALLRCDGLSGFTRGVDLLAAMAEVFWDHLYPLPDEEGLEARMAPVTGLNGQGSDGTLLQPLRKLALFTRPDGTPIACWQYDQSAELASIGDATRRQQRIEAGAVGFDPWEDEARAAGGRHFAALRRDVEAAVAAWQRLSAVLDERAGADSPPTGRVRDMLARLQDIAARYATLEAPAEAVRGAAVPETATGHAPAAAPAASGLPDFASSPGQPGRLRHREDALRALEEIAGFLQRIEPHSPLSYTLQEAVRRGRMSWPELLAEVVPDVSTRATILTSLGIKPPPEAE